MTVPMTTSPGASIDRGASLLGRMHATLANDGKAGEFLGRLTQERRIGAIGHGAVDASGSRALDVAHMTGDTMGIYHRSPNSLTNDTADIMYPRGEISVFVNPQDSRVFAWVSQTF